MVFTPDFTASESADGKTAVFINTSNFDLNDEKYARSSFTTNRLILKDAFGSQTDVIDFPTTGENMDKITLKIEGDKWIEAKLELTGVANYTKIKKFPFYRKFIQRYKSILNSASKRSFLDKDFDFATYFKDVAEYAIPVGNAEEFQNNIDSANDYLNQCQ